MINEKVDLKKYCEEVKWSLAKLSSYDADNLHMIFGLITEVGELADIFKKFHAYGKPYDWVNVAEEIGDIMWYMANFANMNDVDLQGVYESLEEYNEYDTPISIILDMEYNVGMITKLYYEFIKYHKPIDKQFLHGRICLLFRDIPLFCEACNKNFINLQEILDKNVKKLRARYPNNFKQENALNRDLDKERQILEE